MHDFRNQINLTFTTFNVNSSIHSLSEIIIIIPRQSVPQDQKSVTFSHSVISLNQLLQNSKNTAYIFLTFRNHVKLFLPQNILHNVLNVVYRTTLSIRTERTDKTVKTLIRLLLEEQSDQGLYCFVILSASFTQ